MFENNSELNAHDVLIYITLLHKNYFELLKKIETLHIKKIETQKEYRDIIKFLHSETYDVFIENVEKIFGDKVPDFKNSNSEAEA